MFVVRHERIDGSEEIFCARELHYVPKTEQTDGADGVHLGGDARDGVRIGRLRDGIVHVLNDRGVRIWRCDLGGPTLTRINNAA